MDTERKPIPGFEGMYEIDQQGNVYAMFKYRDQSPGWSKSIQTNVDGYRSVVLRSKTCFIHRLMLLTFRPINNPHEMEVNHKDGNKANNSLSNLEWVTHRDNIIHAHKVLDAWAEKGYRGEQINTAKLTVEQVREIRVLHQMGTGRRVLAQQYGVSPENIRAIVLRKTWGHID